MEFSDDFVLIGSVEERIRKIFNPELRRFFIEHKDEFKSFEGNNVAFMLNFGKRISPDFLEMIVDFALRIHKILT
jgi:hypothetical protein